jgi:hypothetical protein
VRSGDAVNLPGIDWRENGRTLLLALSTTCHFCTESGPFYRRIGEGRGDTRLVALFPQGVGEGRRYLRELGVEVNEVGQASLGDLGLSGAPTLIMVDGGGKVLKTWVGLLPSDAEKGVLDLLRPESARN